MIEEQVFHPVVAFAALEAAGSRPLAVELLGRALVVWRDGDGAVHAFEDRCPHRGAALSRGRVVGDTIECPYHGWRMAGSGQCMFVPAVPTFKPPAEHRAVAYVARIAYGLVWVALTGDESNLGAAALPAFDAENEADLYKLLTGPYDVQTSAPRIVENFLDMAHFGFVHEDWLGTRDHTEMRPYRVEATPTGFIAVECFAWQPRASAHAQSGAMIEYTYEVSAPYTAVLTKVPEATATGIPIVREAIALFVCPVTPESSRVWMRMALHLGDQTEQQLREFQDTIFTQDQPVLESQRPKCLPITRSAPVKEVHSAADRGSAAYRRYLTERGVTFGIC